MNAGSIHVRQPSSRLNAVGRCKRARFRPTWYYQSPNSGEITSQGRMFFPVLVILHITRGAFVTTLPPCMYYDELSRNTGNQYTVLWTMLDLPGYTHVASPSTVHTASRQERLIVNILVNKCWHPSWMKGSAPME